MRIYSEIYCTDIEKLDRVRAIRAIQQALHFIEDLYSPEANHEPKQVIALLRECLAEAGQSGIKGYPVNPVAVTAVNASVIAVLVDTLQEVLAEAGTLPNETRQRAETVLGSAIRYGEKGLGSFRKDG